jgi:hypothetical protein
MTTEFKTLWKQNINKIDSSGIASSYYLLHDLILGRDPKKSAFKEITNQNKLMNGMDPWSGYKAAQIRLKWMIQRNELTIQLLAAAGNPEIS